MRQFLLLLAVLLAAQTVAAAPGDRYVPGRLSVRFLAQPEIRHDRGGIRLGDAFDAILRDFPARGIERLFPDSPRIYVPDLRLNYLLTFDPGLEMESLAAMFEATGQVEYAEPDYLMPLYRTPNDPSVGNQYTMGRVDAYEAWDLIPETPSNPDMIIAIIDSGNDWNHPDLINRIWINAGEDLDGDGVIPAGSTPGEADERNGVDDDGNGKIDDFYGWDWIDNISDCQAGEDCDVTDNNPMDFNGHGTHVSGIAAAQTNNGVGVASIAWDARIMCLRAGYSASDGNGYVVQSAAANGIYYAIEMGAKLISMSFGGSGTVRTPATAAYNSGLLCFHAAGNENSSTQDQLDRASGMISVAATESNDCKADYSNYGEWIDVSAPGSAILSTYFNNTYASLYGTSMACPNAASCTALIWWMNPELGNAEVRARLLGTTDDIYSLSCNTDYADPPQLGAGRINAYKGLMNIRETALTLGPVAALDLNGGHLVTGDTLRVDYSITNTGINDSSPLTLTLACADTGIEVLTPTLNLPILPIGITYQGSSWPALIVITDDSPNYLDISLHVAAENAPALDAAVEAMVGTPTILLYDDSAPETVVHTWYRNAFKQLGWIFDWYLSAAGGYPEWPGQPLDLNLYDWTLYASGVCDTTLSAAEQALFTSYLSTGGHDLLFVSQHADEDLAGTAFFTNVLEAQTGAGTSNTRGAKGVAGAFTEGQSMILQGSGGANNQQVPISEIQPAGDGQTIYLDNANVFSTGITSGAGPNCVAYLNFSLEAAGGAGSSLNTGEAMQPIVDQYFHGDAVEQPVGEQPATARLSGVAPNPFNPSSQVSFELTRAGEVRLAAFNLLGQQVALLQQGRLAAGAHTARFDGAGLPSGLYLLRLELDGRLADQTKAVLLK